MKVALIIIFNSRYEKNIPKLRKIYANRFSHIHFVIPFYKEKKKNNEIITVYESGYYFENMVAYTWDAIENEKYDFCFFIPDDMILNPEINEDNFVEYFEIDEKTAFIDKYKSMSQMTLEWPFHQYCLAKYCFERFKGVNYKNEIPEGTTAYKIAEKQGWEELREPLKYPFFRNGWKGDNFRCILKYPKWSIDAMRGKFTFGYPLLQGFSDIFIIPQKYMKKFAKYCGAFGAMNLHVEIAIPTAIMLSCEKVVHQTRRVIEHGDSNDIYVKYNGSYEKMINEWKDDCLFIHPVKLSAWEI